MTLYETIVHNSIVKPKQRAYTYFQYTVSHEKMLCEVEETARALFAMGIRMGDRVAIALPNSPKLLNLLYGLNRIGAVAVLLNPKSPAPEMERQLRMTACKALFFSSVAYRAVLGMKPLLTDMKLSVVSVSIMEHMPLAIRFALMYRAFGKPGQAAFLKAYQDRAMSYSTFMKRCEQVDPALYEAELKRVSEEFDDQKEAVVIFSGGTNGTFKAVVHSSNGLYNSAVNCLKTEEPLPEEVSMLAILPAFHIFGLSVAIHLPLVAEGAIVLVPVFNLSIVTDIIRKECPSFFPGVPTIFERLLKHRKFAGLGRKGRLNFSKFRHGFVGGDTLSDEVRDAFNELIRQNGGEGYISMGYGMSECCPVCVNDRTSAEKECIGLPFDTMQIRILREGTHGPIRSEDILPEGELGEIAYASSYLMLYGFDEEGERNEPISEIVTVEGATQTVQWIRTGDIGYMRDGKLFYRCRERRIIKVSGNTIFADSIERVIEEHIDSVKKAYVVPIPHPLRGHAAFVFVETEEACSEAYSTEEMLERIQLVCKDRMIPYAIPTKLSFIQKDEVPRTAIGKIAWGVLEQRARTFIG